MGVFAYPRKKVQSRSHRLGGLGSDPDFSQFPKDFVHIDGPLAVYGTLGVRLEWFYLATFQDGEALTWVLHVTGNDRLGTTAIYLNLIDMHVVDQYTQKW
jgi:hypothetical protein